VFSSNLYCKTCMRSRDPTRCKPSKQPWTQSLYSHADMGNLPQSDHRETRNIVQSLWFKSIATLKCGHHHTMHAPPAQIIHREAPFWRRGIPLPPKFFNKKTIRITIERYQQQHQEATDALRGPAWPPARRRSAPRWRPAACASRAPSPASAAPR
jgi:hypothetical protein